MSLSNNKNFGVNFGVEENSKDFPSENSSKKISEVTLVKSELLIEDKIEGDKKFSTFKFDLQIDPKSSRKLLPDGANIFLEKFDSFTRIHLTLTLIPELAPATQTLSEFSTLQPLLENSSDTNRKIEIADLFNSFSLTDNSKAESLCNIEQKSTYEVEETNLKKTELPNNSTTFSGGFPSTPAEMLQMMKANENMRTLFSKIRCAS